MFKTRYELYVNGCDPVQPDLMYSNGTTLGKVFRTRGITIFIFLTLVGVQDGKSALYLASECGHACIVQELTAACANINLQDKVPYPLSSRHS